MTPETTPRPATPRRPRAFERRLFLILLAILLVPAAFFVGMSYQQLGRILDTIEQRPGSHTAAILQQAPPAFSSEAAALALEIDVVQHRHVRTAALLATRTWMRFMSLIFGAVLIVIGAAFVLGRVSGPAYEAEASMGDASGSLKSSSPGLFLVAAGIVLIAIPNLSTQQIQTDDTSSYFVQQPGGPGAAGGLSAEALKELKSKHGISESTP